MPSGTIRVISEAKGYGLIVPTAGGPEVFVDVAAVSASELTELGVGARVGYNLISDPASGRVSASELRVLEPASTANLT